MLFPPFHRKGILRDAPSRIKIEKRSWGTPPPEKSGGRSLGNRMVRIACMSAGRDSLFFPHYPDVKRDKKPYRPTCQKASFKTAIRQFCEGNEEKARESFQLGLQKRAGGCIIISRRSPHHEKAYQQRVFVRGNDP